MAQDSSVADFWDKRYHDGVMPWDAGHVPARFAQYVGEIPAGSRVLVPGCGSGYDVALLARAGLDVLAIDFSAAAIEVARRHLGPLSDRVQFADFFAFDAGPGFDVVVERAFLCALPRKRWPAYAARMAAIVRPGGSLAGYWFFDDNERGPPFGTSAEALETLLQDGFSRATDEPVADSLPVFAGRERWQIWRRQ